MTHLSAEQRAFHPLFTDLSRALADAGQPRLSAWAQLRAVLLGADPGETSPDLDLRLWAARVESPSEPEVLLASVSLPSFPSVWTVARELWRLPPGPARDAVQGSVDRIAAATGEDLSLAPGAPPHAALLLAVEALEEALWRAGQRAPVAACVAFRLALERRWLASSCLGGHFHAWIRLAGTPLRSWSWLCVGDASGLADQVRRCYASLPAERCPVVEGALHGVLRAAGLPPDATEEAGEAARREALARLARAVASGPPRPTYLIGALEAALEGDQAEAARRLARCSRLGLGRRLNWRAHVEVGDLVWLVARLRGSLRGREARAALRALEALT